MCGEVGRREEVVMRYPLPPLQVGGGAGGHGSSGGPGRG